MQKLFIILLCTLLFTACETNAVTNSSPADFATKIKNEGTFLLDVRTQGEFNEGHIKGATLIPVQELKSRITELESQKEKTILVYCRSGRRSLKAAKILHQAGFTKVVNLKSGINGWIKAGLPVTK